MMKEAVARQLGGQLGKYIKMDCRYPGYMRVCVEFPLNKLPVRQMKVKIKERGLMVITLRYENVSLFCFAYGRMDHAVNCEDEVQLDDQCIKFGEELSASPPKRAKEIIVKQVAASMVKPLFQVGVYGAMAKNGSHASRGSPRTCETKLDIGGKETLPFMQGSKAVQSDRLNKFISADLAAGVNDMYMGAQRGLVENAMQGRDRKDRVSVGTDMTPDDTVSTGASMPEVEQHLATTGERLHARKFGMKNATDSDKKSAPRVATTGTGKKQKTPFKEKVKGVIKMLGEDELKLMAKPMQTEHEERTEVMIAHEAATLKSDPETLTGTLDEAHQEQ
jgi:hypothetical protein